MARIRAYEDEATCSQRAGLVMDTTFPTCPYRTNCQYSSRFRVFFNVPVRMGPQCLPDAWGVTRSEQRMQWSVSLRAGRRPGVISVAFSGSQRPGDVRQHGL
jgi:hypothetical protein